MKHVGLGTSAQRALDNLLIAYNNYVGTQGSTPMSEKAAARPTHGAPFLPHGMRPPHSPRGDAAFRNNLEIAAIAGC